MDPCDPQQAAAEDLPTSLAGIAVRISQGNSPDMQAAIFAVQQQEPCGLSGLQAGDAGCLLTLVKIQVPFELAGDPVSGDQKTYSYAPPALLSIDVDGHRGRGFPLQPLSRQRPRAYLLAMPRGTPRLPASVIASCIISMDLSSHGRLQRPSAKRCMYCFMAWAVRSPW